MGLDISVYKIIKSSSGELKENVKNGFFRLTDENKESEDEKIRKWLIALIKSNEYGSISNVGEMPCPKLNVLAWLEKQGDANKEYWRGYREGKQEILDKYAELEKQDEQKPTLPKWKYKKDNTPLLRDSLILNKYGCVAKSPSGAIVSDVWVLDYDELAKLPKEEIEKQGEQNLADKVEPKFNVGDKIQYLKGCGTIMTIEKIENGEYIFANNLGHTTIEDGNKWYLVECNPTWSEYDESAMWLLKDIVRHSNEINEKIYTMPLKEKLYDWLKSIKDRALTQPKLEWNEEDEDILNTIINYFEIDLECTENDDIIRWLKSLRPQNRWKPSDEQMKAIEHICDGNYKVDLDILDSIYRDFKKLRGE